LGVEPCLEGKPSGAVLLAMAWPAIEQADCDRPPHGPGREACVM
jgi:hypothetical protein